MDYWIEECEFERLEGEDSVTIEGGIDSFERVSRREEDEGIEHVFKLDKRSDIFEVEFRWVVRPESEEEESWDDERFMERAKNLLRSESSYHLSHYLKSMEYPPIQSLFSDGMVVEMVTESNDE